MSGASWLRDCGGVPVGGSSHKSLLGDAESTHRGGRERSKVRPTLLLWCRRRWEKPHLLMEKEAKTTKLHCVKSIQQPFIIGLVEGNHVFFGRIWTQSNEFTGIHACAKIPTGWLIHKGFPPSNPSNILDHRWLDFDKLDGSLAGWFNQEANCLWTIQHGFLELTPGGYFSRLMAYFGRWTGGWLSKSLEGDWAGWNLTENFSPKLWHDLRQEMNLWKTSPCHLVPEHLIWASSLIRSLGTQRSPGVAEVKHHEKPTCFESKPHIFNNEYVWRWLKLI